MSGSYVEDIVHSVDDDCDCPTIDCLIWPFDVNLHIEPDGTGHGLFYNGDSEHDIEFKVSTMDELKTKACEFVDNLIMSWKELY